VAAGQALATGWTPPSASIEIEGGVAMVLFRF